MHAHVWIGTLVGEALLVFLVLLLRSLANRHS